MSDRPCFDIRVSQRGDACVLELSGELDINSGARLLATLADTRYRLHTQMIFDLRGLTFMDSFGLRAILAAAAGCDGPSLRLVPGSPIVQRVFELTGTKDRLPWTSKDFKAVG